MKPVPRRAMVQHLFGQDFALIGPQEAPDLHAVPSQEVGQRSYSFPRRQVKRPRFGSCTSGQQLSALLVGEQQPWVAAFEERVPVHGLRRALKLVTVAGLRQHVPRPPSVHEGPLP